MSTVLAGLDAVLEGHSTNAAIMALQNETPGAITDARFDRNELTLTIARESIREAAIVIKNAGYNFLEDVTCVDWLPAKNRFQVTYHVLSHSLKERVRLIAFVKESDLQIASITSVWPSANFYEREIFDLFGIRFGGHPDMRRIMMPDAWEGHPLRKDYPVEGYR